MTAQSPLFAQTVEDGFKYLRNEEYAKARAAFKAAASSDPSAKNLYYLGNFYLALDKPDSAATLFQQALEKDRKEPLVHVGLAELDLIKKNAEGAAEHFDDADHYARDRDAETYYRIGQAYLRHGTNNAKEAIAAFSKAVDIDGKNPKYYVGLGNAYLESNNASKASQNYEQAIYFDANYAPAYVAVGSLYLRSKNYNEARDQYNKAVEADPNFAPAYKELGNLFYRFQQYGNAAENYGKFVQLGEPTQDELLTYAGYLYLNKQYDESLQQLEKVGSDYPNPIVHRLLAYDYFETKQYQPGTEQMTIFMQEAKPEDIIAQDYETQGRLAMAAGDTTTGISGLVHAANMDTSKVGLLKEVALIYYDQHKFDEAGDMFDTMMQKGVDLSATDLFRLGLSRYFADEYGKADSAFAKVNETAETSLPGWVWRARANAKIDSTSEQGLAKPFYEKVIELASADSTKNESELIEANRYLGYYYFLQADQENSEKYLNDVLALNPEDETAKTLLDAIEAGQIGKLSGGGEPSDSGSTGTDSSGAASR
ncbi:MAG TPA: tetratricopeptide repeat protein [Rhodothermales bacterium]|nr:tetratricopeptide repeat protein [Rhodothermales bacterium]